MQGGGWRNGGGRGLVRTLALIMWVRRSAYYLMARKYNQHLLPARRRRTFFIWLDDEFEGT